MGVLLLMFLMGTKIKPVFQSELDEKVRNAQHILLHIGFSVCIRNALCVSIRQSCAYALMYCKRHKCIQYGWPSVVQCDPKTNAFFWTLLMLLVNQTTWVLMLKYDTDPNATCTRESCAYLVKNHFASFFTFFTTVSY